MDRHKKARVIAERVAARVREVAPPGLGRWDLTWNLVAAPSDVFMDALAVWQEADTPATRSELATASTALVTAWSEASRHWERAGRPAHDESEAITA